MFVKRTVGRSFKECPTGANYQTKKDLNYEPGGSAG
jgi:hypothetical protein